MTVVLLAGADIRLRWGVLRFSAGDPLRPWALGSTAAAALLVLGWRTPTLRRTSLTFLSAFAALALMISASSGPPTWPVADAALIELYTIHAMQGQQLLGAYSQFGWNHPGPALFLALAPFYALGGQTPLALSAGALAINLAAVITVVWVLKCHGEPTFVLCLISGALIVVYATRLAPLLTSPWNAHVLIFPLAGLMVAAAAVLAGDRLLLPMVAAWASFTAQAHIGALPVSAALGTVCLAATALAWRCDPRSRSAVTRSLKATGAVLAAMWVLPLVEFAAFSPSNLIHIWSFFAREAARTQDLHFAWLAWGNSLMALTGPDLHIPYGWRYEPWAGIWRPVCATLMVAALPAASLYARRAGRQFLSALSGVCFVAAAIGFWSVLNVRGVLVDHSIFWLSAVGVVSAAAMAGTVAAAAIRVPALVGALGGAVVAIATVLILAGIGYREMGLERERAARGPQNEGFVVRTVYERLVPAMERFAIQKPVLAVQDELLPNVGAGLLLQFARNDQPIAVSQRLVRFFGRPWTPTGDEDAILTVVDTREHKRLESRPGNLFVAGYLDVYVDAVRLEPLAR